MGKTNKVNKLLAKLAAKGDIISNIRNGTSTPADTADIKRITME